LKLYENNWDSLNSRPVPRWFSDAKFGIFIHWGLYSVPSFTKRGNYAEWYGMQLNDQNDDTVRKFHERVYGADFKYAEFARDFKAELFDADEWAELFRNAGAKYINITSKHHDGFCLFKTQYAPFWNSVDVGPHRDICAELKAACDKTDVRFGVYHSVYEWWNPIYLRSPEEYAVKHLHPMLKELIENYRPYTLFTDGEWSHPSEVWHSTEFLTWLYNESSVRDTIVPNDRWGKGTRGKLGGNFTSEYGYVDSGVKIDLNCGRPFEECRGIGGSFGFNRIERPEDYLDSKALLIMLCDLVSKGGNLLLNVGPAADGTIPAIMQERLLDMGKWLKVNGEAIYESGVYTLEESEGVYYTQREGNIYAVTEKYPYGNIVLDKIPYEDGMTVTILGCDAVPTAYNADGKLGVDVPFVSPDDMRSSLLYTFKITKK